MTKRKKRPPTRRQRPSVRSPFPPRVQFATSPVVGTNGRVPKAAQPRPTEPTFLHIWVMTQERKFSSKQEFEAFLSSSMTPGEKPHFPEPTLPWHKAQSLAYEGWEEESARQRRKIAQQALALSADAVDGHLLLAHDATSWQEAARFCAQAVTAGERLMGPDPFRTYAGRFWDAAITRPYMRARLALGYALWRQGERAEAQAHFEGLLRLNANDHQGARYLLTAVLLEQGKEGEALRVMNRYPRDGLCFWAYNRLLGQFHRRGDHLATHREMELAVSINPFVPILLLTRQQISSWELLAMEPGKRSEAMEYVQLYSGAWAMEPGALEWLEQKVSAGL